MTTTSDHYSTPSLYPRPSSLNQQPQSEPLPEGYDLLISVQATVTEKSSSSSSSSSSRSRLPHRNRRSNSPNSHQIQVSGLLRILQGPAPSTSTSSGPNLVHAFLSIDTLSLPLIPAVTARGDNDSRNFFLSFPQPATSSFQIVLHQKTESNLVSGFRDLLKWFCTWTSSDGKNISPGGLVSDAQSSSSDQPDRFAALGDRGVAFVEKHGQRIQSRIERKFSSRRNPEDAPMNRKNSTKAGSAIGGAGVTVLSGASAVVGRGAKIASHVSEKVSGGIAHGITQNSMSRSIADAPRGTLKRRFADELRSGAAAFGRVYLAADQQGKLIIECTTDNASAAAGEKYGDNAEAAGRNVGRLAVDGYRIFRFPQKLGATAIVKSAVKKTAVNASGK